MLFNGLVISAQWLRIIQDVMLALCFLGSYAHAYRPLSQGQILWVTLRSR